MKKLKVIFLAFVFVALIFSGCGDLNENIKLAPTTEGLADYYFNYAQEATYLDCLAFSKVSETDVRTKTQLNGIFNIMFDSLNDSMAIACAVDFCAGIKSGEDVSATNKLYEFSIPMRDSKRFINVKKKSKKDSVFDVDLYGVGINDDFDYATDHYQPDTYSFTVAPDNKLEKFTVSYTVDDKKCSAELLFYPQKGTMHFSINKYNESFSENAINTQIEIYNYKNNTSSARTLVSLNGRDGADINMIFEYLNKSFIQRGKFGYIKDASKYSSLNATLEEVIGEVNEGDDYGYAVKYNDQLDSANSENGAKITLEEYGIFPSD